MANLTLPNYGRVARHAPQIGLVRIMSVMACFQQVSSTTMKTDLFFRLQEAVPCPSVRIGLLSVGQFCVEINT
jgi:hypothetical protein